MRYQALYRKYRPQRFDEVVGQDHVVGTLTREVTDDKVAHAYLFAGPRGTGKTTSARLLAKSLNCTNREADGEPCNECASCLGITEGTSLDVIELDAASHNKVEDVREIRVNVGTVAAAEGAHRIYILDEAHMLSRAAGNALLKTLEEPPEHVVFVLATTEPYKLLDTIRSRSQRFDFHPVSSETLVEHLSDISKREGFTTDTAGLSMIATHARGSVRDAMSLLEQVAALGGGAVSTEGVTKALGLADGDAFTGLVAAISDQDAPAALGLVAQLASRGADLRRFVADSLGFFRGIFLAQYAPNLEEITDEPPEILVEWRRQGHILSSADVLRAIDRFSEALLHLRQGREERLVLELALIRLTRPETTLDGAALASRIERLEQEARNAGATSYQLPAIDDSSPTPSPSPFPSPSPSPSSDSSPSGGGGPSAARDGEGQAPNTDLPSSDPGGAADDGGDQAAKTAGAAAESPLEEDALDLGDIPPQAEIEATPSAEAGAAPGVPSSAEVTLAEFSVAWPVIVARIRSDFGARRHAFVRVAEPESIESNVAVLTLPAHQHFHLEQLNADDQLLLALESLTAEVLGSTVTLRFRSDDDADPGQIAESVRAPDQDQLDEGPTREDPENLIVDMLGGTVVEE
jgi:DNA polymerase-3 subunit gamma/tau